MSGPNSFSLASEITPLADGQHAFSPGSFSLTAIFAGEGDGVEDIWQGAMGQALLELFGKAGNAAKSSGIGQAAASVGQGANNTWQQFNAAMMGRQQAAMGA